LPSNIKKNMAITFKEEHSVGVKEIDDQHKQFIAILNELADAIDNNKTKETLAHIFDELGSYAEFHFATEEKYFDMFSYDGAEEHKAKHQELKEKIADLKSKMADNQVSLSFELIDFMEDWLIDHLANMDQKYVQCFKEHGLS